MSAGAHYSLRSVICYFGHHYQAFVLSEELQQWLLFDDAVIKVVGDWQQVKTAMINNRLQPSLLFYEAQDV
jgi:ubiquitin C-terminal hydrolase